MGTCTKCGANFVGTAQIVPPNNPCHYCQIDTLKFENMILRKALVGIVGADGRDDLNGMEMALRLATMPAKDKAVTIDAIHALRDTLLTGDWGFKDGEAYPK